MLKIAGQLVLTGIILFVLHITAHFSIWTVIYFQVLHF